MDICSLSAIKPPSSTTETVPRPAKKSIAPWKQALVDTAFVIADECTMMRWPTCSISRSSCVNTWISRIPLRLSCKAAFRSPSRAWA